MAGEPTPSVLAVLCSLLWKEGPRLLDGQGGDAEAADTARAGGSLQVNVQNWTDTAFTILKQDGWCNQHPISYLGVTASGFPSLLNLG